MTTGDATDSGSGAAIGPRWLVARGGPDAVRIPSGAAYKGGTYSPARSAPLTDCYRTR